MNVQRLKSLLGVQSNVCGYRNHKISIAVRDFTFFRVCKKLHIHHFYINYEPHLLSMYYCHSLLFNVMSHSPSPRIRFPNEIKLRAFKRLHAKLYIAILKTMYP